MEQLLRRACRLVEGTAWGGDEGEGWEEQKGGVSTKTLTDVLRATSTNSLSNEH